jgi:hypothetical protein
MTSTRRTVARAGIATLGILALAACNNDSTAPLNVTPDQLQSLGQSIATEIESGAMGMTSQGVTSTTGGAPTATFSRVPTNASALFGLSLNRIPAGISRSTAAADCGSPSQNPPVDTDGDQVPDNFTISFALPACHFVDASGTIDITGALRITDPQPTTPGMALNFGLENFTLAFSSNDGTSGTISRDGSSSVTVSGSGLSETSNWTESALINGLPSVSATLNWAATYVVAQGQSIVTGQPLPDGAFSPNGSVDYREGNRTASFSITTITPLQYSASCAAGVENGTALTPFSSGTIRVTVSSQQGGGSVDVSYTNCSSATVTLVQ